MNAMYGIDFHMLINWFLHSENVKGTTQSMTIATVDNSMIFDMTRTRNEITE